MKEKTTAQAMGDAIRDRAHILNQDNNNIDELPSSFEDKVVTSLGWSLGMSATPRTPGAVAAAPGVQVSQTAVVANYFLSSHGGMHGIQSLCSLGCVVFGSMALVLDQQDQVASYIKQTLASAILKHTFGLVGAISVTSILIPEIGLRKARKRLEGIAQDPVSQYMAYSVLLFVWTSVSTGVGKIPNIWIGGKNILTKYTPLVLLAPILLREIISTIWVIADVLVLVSSATSTNEDEQDSNSSSKITSTVVGAVLKFGHSMTNIVMSLLVTPETWRSAGIPKQQEILAKLVSRASLAFEVLVGVMLGIDTTSTFLFTYSSLVAVNPTTTSTTQQERPSFVKLAIKLTLARFYWNFLQAKRKKIVKLVSNIRGGSVQLPVKILDILLHPGESMGIQDKDDKGDNNPSYKWKERWSIAFGLND